MSWFKKVGRNGLNVGKIFSSLINLTIDKLSHKTCWKICVYIHITSMLFSCQIVSNSFVIPWTVACQAPLSMGFPRQEYWSGLPFSSPRDLPNPSLNPCLLHWQATSLPLSPQRCPYWIYNYQFSSVQLLSCVRLCDPMNRSTPGLPVHQQLPEFTQTHIQWVSDAIQPSHPLSSPSPPAPNPSQHQSFPMTQLFAWGGQSTGVSFSISPSKEIPGLISFRMDWLDLLAVQGTLKSLLQHYSSKASVL